MGRGLVPPEGMHFGPAPSRGGYIFEQYGIPGAEEGWQSGGSPLHIARLLMTGPQRMERPYLQHWAIHACVRRRADALASLPLTIWADRSDDSTRVTSGSLFDLLNRPNPLMGKRRLQKVIEIYLLHDGECFLAKLDKDYKPITTPSTPPAVLFPIRGAWMDGVRNPNKGGLLDQWRYSGTDAQAFESWQVVRLSEFNPYNPTRGLGTVQAAIRLADQDYLIDNFTDSLVRNGGMPSQTFSSASPITKEQAKDAEDRLEQKRKEGGPIFFGNGLTPLNAGFSPVDMQFMEGRTWNLQAIMALFGVTKPLLAITDDVNRANAKEALAVFLEYVMLPHALEIEDELRDQLMMPVPEWAAMDLGFDAAQAAAMSEDRSLKLERVKLWVDMGLTVQKAAEIEEVDVLIQDSDLKPIPQPIQIPQTGPPRDFSAERLALDEKRRALAWQSYAQGIAPMEQQLATTVQQVQGAYLADVMAWLRAAAAGKIQPSQFAADGRDSVAAFLAALLPTEFAHVDTLRQRLSIAYAQIIEQQAAAVARAAGNSIPLFGVRDATASAFAQTRAVRVAEGTMSTLAKSIQQHMAEVLASEGYTTTNIAEGIRETLAKLEEAGELIVNQTIPARAQTIAITETGITANFARVGELAASGVERIEWVSSRDGNVRDSHQSVDGNVIEIGQTFSNGMRWPQDPAGPAGEVVNCRCTAVAAASEV